MEKALHSLDFTVWEQILYHRSTTASQRQYTRMGNELSGQEMKYKMGNKFIDNL